MKARSWLSVLALMLIGRCPAPETDGSFTRLYPDSKARNRRRAAKREALCIREARRRHVSLVWGKDRPAGTKIARMAEAGRIGKAHP